MLEYLVQNVRNVKCRMHKKSICLKICAAIALTLAPVLVKTLVIPVCFRL